MTALVETTTADEATSRSMRTGVLIHPTGARSGRLLILPHPRTLVPTYYLSSSGELFELSTLNDSKHDRSWMISRLNQVVSSGQLDLLSKVDTRFVVVGLLYSVLGDGKYRSREDTFEQIALALYATRREAACGSMGELKAKLGQGEDEAQQSEWTDVVTLGTLETVKTALEDVCDVQDLPNGDQAYRLSLGKTFALLDNKHSRLSQQHTFISAPNTLGRTFERSWPHDSDPSPYLTAPPSPGEPPQDCKEALQLRRHIAAEVVATYLPNQLAHEWCAHLGIQG